MTAYISHSYDVALVLMFSCCYTGQFTGVKKGGFTPDNCTLEMRKVPAQFNNIAKLNEHFSKFGTIVNLQVGQLGHLRHETNSFRSPYEIGWHLVIKATLLL